ncbi:MAG: peptide-methionine (S)-S-oxide reductase MsrA [Methanobrevibacter sp.]|nr:peptide-methionine (S)-S-oxide reductase MsrA [Methanobrevibacter sp.]
MFLTENFFPIAKLINLEEELLIMFEKLEVIYLAGGCFWGVEAFISRLHGVNHTEVGYANGRDLAPTYEKVCSEKTGHVETVKVTYNPKFIGLENILENFFKIIDPYTLNRQGADIGTQYRTGIYWQEDFQRDIVLKFLAKKRLESSKKIVVEARPIINFYPAEDYHQKYLEKNPQGYCHVDLNLIDDEEFKHLTKEEYEITQLSLTEPPFSGKYDNFFEEGIYVDVVDGEILFSSDDKFDSGCGWPAFTKPVSQDVITQNRDFSYGTTRIEVRSAKSNSHLGHVFHDGPGGSRRYCINSNALKFIPKDEVEKYIKNKNKE